MFIWSDIVIYSVFKLQEDVISKTECVDKDVVDSHCKGSCVLTKRLATTEEGSQPNTVIVDLKIDLFVTQIKPLQLQSFNSKRHYNLIVETELIGFTQELKYPPEMV